MLHFLLRYKIAILVQILDNKMSEHQVDIVPVNKRINPLLVVESHFIHKIVLVVVFADKIQEFLPELAGQFVDFTFLFLYRLIEGDHPRVLNLLKDGLRKV